MCFILQTKNLKRFVCSLLATIMLSGLFSVGTFAVDLYDVDNALPTNILETEGNFPSVEENATPLAFGTEAVVPFNTTIGVVAPQDATPPSGGNFAPWWWLNDDPTTHTVVVGSGFVQALPLVGGDYPATGPWDATHRPYIETIIFTEPFTTIGRSSLASLFRGLPNLRIIENINYIDLANTNWLSSIFRSAGSLTTIDGLDAWDVADVRRFSSMFRETNFTILDLSGWDMAFAERLDSMFRSTSNLSSVAGLATWDTSRVQWMSWMFMNATGFSSLDLTNFDTSSTQRMASMFQDAINLTQIIGINTWNTSNLETIESMFRGASHLTSLDLSNWNTSRIGTNSSSATTFGMRSAFRDMERLESLNLEGWDTRHLTPVQMELMFGGSNNLKELTLGANWEAQGTPNQQGLVTPPGPRYTGYWVNVGTETVETPQGDKRLTPAELMTGTSGASETWVWERSVSDVTFLSGSNGSISHASPHIVNNILYGNTLTAIQIPTPLSASNHEFAYWKSSTGSTYTTEELLALEITASKEFTAIFVPSTAIQVTFVLNGGFYDSNINIIYRYISPNDPIMVANVPIPTRIGWTFRGWVEEGGDLLLNSSQVGALTVVAPRTFVAQWQHNDHELELEPELELGLEPEFEPKLESRLEPESVLEPQPTILERQSYLIGSGGFIRPNDNITRAEVATILFRLITDEERSAYWAQENPFSDVELHNWFNNAVSTMANAGVFSGLPNGSFAPNQTITRAEMAAVIVRFMEQMDGMSLSENHFKDIFGHWAVEYINTAAINGWASGFPDGTFRPSQPLTRAEAVAMLNRILGRLVVRTEDLLPDMQTWPDNANVNSWYYFYIQSATNSYTFKWRGVDNAFERWDTIIPIHDWSILERSDSRIEDILRPF